VVLGTSAKQEEVVRRPPSERLHAARGEATRQRLIGEVELPDRADERWFVLLARPRDSIESGQVSRTQSRV